ncbi:MAG: hypothetical protein WA862_12195 [Solirubrobacterales bacterium]
MRRPKTSLTIAIPLAALAIAGCGGDDDSTSTEATTETAVALSKEDLISQGDAICGEVNKAVGAAEIVSAEGGESELATKVAGLYVGMVESIKSLGTPDDDTGYPEFIAAADELSAAEDEVKLAAEREDTLALEEVTNTATSAREEFETAAGEYGFEDCSEGPSAPTASPGSTGAAPVEEAEEGGVEVAPEELEEEVVPEEEVAPEEAAPETGGAGGGVEEAAPESGGSAGGTSGGVGPG